MCAYPAPPPPQKVTTKLILIQTLSFLFSCIRKKGIITARSEPAHSSKMPIPIASFDLSASVRCFAVAFAEVQYHLHANPFVLRN